MYSNEDIPALFPRIRIIFTRFKALTLRLVRRVYFAYLSQFVPDGLKDEKYWARRRKNNMAAKRSRDARRMKENQIALRAGFLEKEVIIVPCERNHYKSRFQRLSRRILHAYNCPKFVLIKIGEINNFSK